MKTIYILAILIFFSCGNKPAMRNVLILENIVKVESIIMSNNTDTRASISKEHWFDDIDMGLKKSVSKEFKPSSIVLGEVMSNLSKVDIRTKTYITYQDGKVEKLFLDFRGRVLYNGKVYDGSNELLLFLRCGVIDFDR